eukprot:6492147-Amphidinium_carterae.1
MESTAQHVNDSVSCVGVGYKMLPGHAAHFACHLKVICTLALCMFVFVLLAWQQSCAKRNIEVLSLGEVLVVTMVVAHHGYVDVVEASILVG